MPVELGQPSGMDHGARDRAGYARRARRKRSWRAECRRHRVPSGDRPPCRTADHLAQAAVPRSDWSQLLRRGSKDPSHDTPRTPDRQQEDGRRRQVAGGRADVESRPSSRRWRHPGISRAARHRSSVKTDTAEVAPRWHQVQVNEVTGEGVAGTKPGADFWPVDQASQQPHTSLRRCTSPEFGIEVRQPPTSSGWSLPASTVRQPVRCATGCPGRSIPPDARSRPLDRVTTPMTSRGHFTAAPTRARCAGSASGPWCPGAASCRAGASERTGGAGRWVSPARAQRRWLGVSAREPEVAATAPPADRSSTSEPRQPRGRHAASCRGHHGLYSHPCTWLPNSGAS